MKSWIKYQILFRDVTPSALTLSTIILLMVCETGISLFSPWLAGRFTESLLSSLSHTGLNYKHLLVLWLFLLAIKGVLTFYNNYFTGKTTQLMLTRLRVNLYNHLQMLPVNYYHEKKHGEIIALLTNDATIISHFITQTLVSIIPLAITFFGTLICIYFFNQTITLLAALLIPLFYLTAKLLGRSIRVSQNQ